ncbi:MAG: hypothetical protein AAGG51_09995 [Cyanobacteria bacterium P01_G01_bin.54]
MSKLLKLAKQGDAQAIATLLGEKLEPKGIWVLAQRQDDTLELIFESLQAPPQGSMTQFIERGMRSLQPIGLRRIRLHGRQMGESADAWQAQIEIPFIAPSEPEAPAEPELPEPELNTVPSVAETAQITNPTRQSSNALIAAAQRGEKGALSSLLAREFRNHNVVVRTTLMGTCLQINFSGPDATDQAQYAYQADQAVRLLQLPFVQWLRIQGFARGQDEPLWSMEYDPNDPATAPDYVDEPFKERELDPDGRNCLLWGLGIGAALALMPFTRFVLSYFVILVHEIGHAIAYWLFGYPAVPTFNFLHGGGIALALNRLSFLPILLMMGLAYLCYRYRHNVPTQQTLGIVLLLYALFTVTPLHQIVISAMGHGGELLAIAFCFYCALGKRFCPYPGERFLYAMLAWFTLFKVLGFMGSLITSPSFRQDYFNGIGGVLENDLVVLAEQYHLFGVTPLAMIFLLAALVMPGLSWLAFRYERRWMTSLVLMTVQDRNELIELKRWKQSDAETRVMRRSPR